VLANAGIEVALAANGYEAIERLGQQRFDAVLMDVQMPQMDGLEATRRIRALPDAGALPIIAMTAAARGEDRAASRLAGMNAHLAKPIDNELLARTLLEWIPARADAGAPRDGARRAQAPPAGETGSVTGLDLAVALARLDGRRDLLDKLLRQFAQTHELTPAQLRDALSRGDRAAVQRLAHRLKGEAGNLGLDRVARAAADVLDAERVQPDGDPQRVEALAAVCEAALAMLRERTQEAPPHPGAGAPAAQDAAALRERLHALRELLAGGTMAARDAVEEIAAGLPAGALGMRFAAIVAAVQQLDFDLAESVLAQLIDQLDAPA
jgi:two-component system sensor histidine kinase/response regulator